MSDTLDLPGVVSAVLDSIARVEAYGRPDACYVTTVDLEGRVRSRPVCRKLMDALRTYPECSVVFDGRVFVRQWVVRHSDRTLKTYSVFAEAMLEKGDDAGEDWSPCDEPV